MRRLVVVLSLAACRHDAPAQQHQVEAAVQPSATVVSTPSIDAAPVATGPTVANHALMLSLADGSLPFSRIVDEHAGVVLLDGSADPSEGKSPRPREGLYCGAELHAMLDLWKSRLGDKTTGLRARYAEGRLSCQNAPDPTCILRGSMEYDPTVHFLFRSTPTGLVLRAIAMLDELLVDPGVVTTNRAATWPSVKKYEAPGCP